MAIFPNLINFFEGAERAIEMLTADHFYLNFTLYKYLLFKPIYLILGAVIFPKKVDTRCENVVIALQPPIKKQQNTKNACRSILFLEVKIHESFQEMLLSIFPSKSTL